MPQSVTRTRAVAAALVLATHALLVLLLQIEGRGRPETIASSPRIASITIRLFPVGPPVPDQPDESVAPQPQPAPVPAPGVFAPAIAPEPVSGAPAAAEDQPASVDWNGRASELAARIAQQAETPRTFSQPLQVMRQPCTPRTRYDKATRELMEPLLPQDNDPVPPGGIGPAPSSVRMGGVRVGIVRIGGGEDKSRQDSSSGRKPSFRWKWDTPDMKNGGLEELLTSGWAEAVPYDGMFDDMLQGRTPRSSVPDPDKCD